MAVISASGIAIFRLERIISSSLAETEPFMTFTACAVLTGGSACEQALITNNALGNNKR